MIRLIWIEQAAIEIETETKRQDIHLKESELVWCKLAWSNDNGMGKETVE